MLFLKMDRNGLVLLLDTIQEPIIINILLLILKLLRLSINIYKS